ncbi:MAG: penicillin-binding protein 2 [Acidimicrobiia bacterium]|nr:MAG: penicillin-binding protein 2 [Acidimicrobiia bacterium]
MSHERPVGQAGSARLFSIGVVLVVMWTLVGYRLTVVQGAQAETFAARGLDQRLDRQTLAADRGTIFDRDGRELAVTVDSVTIYANPREIADPAAVAETLAPLVGRHRTDLERDLSQDGEFVYVARQLDLAVGEAVREAGLPGIHLLTEPKRVYPAGSLAAHVVGFVRADDNEGLEGLELFYDEALAGSPGSLLVERDPQGLAIPQGEYLVEPAQPGSDLVLTIKSEIQYAAERELAAALERTGARSGSVVVIDPATGEILAMVNLPSYDPNDRTTITPQALRNRAVTDVFEPGSTQKVVTISAALESGVVVPGTTFDIPDEIVIQDTVFEDVTEHAPALSVTEIVTYSSNLGTILIGDLLGARRLHTYMASFGQGSPTGVDYPGEASGVLRPHQDWCATTCLASTSIGYRLAVTPLQMAMVYATLANDGVWVQPRLVQRVVDGDGRQEAVEEVERRVLSADTAQKLRLMLEEVVSHGTGSLAAVPGYRVGGKTGTTEKYLEESGVYSEDDVVASFIGMAPIDDPRVVVAVVLDSPQTDASGGKGAAPVFAAVTLAALNQLGVPPGG